MTELVNEEPRLVVRHTFWHLENEEFRRRPRAFSDPQIQDFEFEPLCKDDVISNQDTEAASDDLSSSNGYETDEDHTVMPAYLEGETSVQSFSFDQFGMQTAPWQFMSLAPIVIMAPPQEESAVPVKMGKVKTRSSKALAKVTHRSKVEHSVRDTRTTVMVQNLPRQMTRADLLQLLDTQGFIGQYSFVYMPIDLTRQETLGYAFVNLISPEVVPLFWRTFDGFKDWTTPTDKVCRVSWSNPHQGLEEHIERYRNSPLMHSSVPDYARPVLFQNGVRIDFHAPTKSIRAPRLRPPRGGRDRCVRAEEDSLN